MFVLRLLSLSVLLVAIPDLSKSEEVWRCLHSGEARERITNLPVGESCRLAKQTRFQFSRVPQASFAEFHESTRVARRQTRKANKIPSTVTYRERSEDSEAGSLGRKRWCLLRGSFLAAEAGTFRVRIYRGATQIEEHYVSTLKAGKSSWSKQLAGPCRGPRTSVKKISAAKGLAD